MCVHTYTQKTYHNRHKRDNPISRRTSTVAKSCIQLKVAKFHRVRTERNKRLFNMSANPPADDVQTSPAQVHGAKVVKILQMCKFSGEKSKD